MKRFLFCILLFPLLAALLQFTAFGFAAEWRPYPLIKDGAINENKWRIDGSSAVITPAGDNRVRFLHQGPPADPTWLFINQCPERVKGMKVTVQMGEDITSQMRARIGSNIGAYGANNDYLWSDLNVLKRDPDEGGDEFYGVLAGWDLFHGIWQYDLTYVKFFKPIDLVGNLFRLTLQHDEKKIKFSVDGYGSSIYKLPQIIKPPYELIWSIGTVSIDETGGGTVYFSDVEVLIDGECDTTRPSVKSTYPANDQRKVPVNLEKIRVTFNESMNPWTWEWNPPLSGDTEYRYPKTFVVYNQGETLAYQTWYEVCLEKNGFIDLAGNGNREYCFSFKTEREPAP